MQIRNFVIFRITLIVLLFLVLVSDIANASLKDYYFVPQRRALIFVEDYYSLYRRNLYHRSDSHIANIHYLKIAFQKALANKWWAHPVKVFSYFRFNWKTTLNTYTQAQHAKYKELLKMRLAFLLTKEYLDLGARYDKENIYWFNVEQIETDKNKEHHILRGFRIASACYMEAGKYFFLTKEFARKLQEDIYQNQLLLDKQKPKKEAIPFSKINMFDSMGGDIDSMLNEAYEIYFGGSMIEEDHPLLQNKKIKLSIPLEQYIEKVDLYKKNKKYFHKEAYPKYNYSKIIRDRLFNLETKKLKFNALLTQFKNKQNEN